MADFLEDSFHALHHFFVECLVAALEEFAAFTIEGDAFLLLHLPVFEEGLFFGFVDGGILDLFFEVAEVGFDFADASEAFVVVFLDASALDVDLLLCVVGFIELFEEFLHVYGSDFDVTVLSGCGGDESYCECGADETFDEDHYESFGCDWLRGEFGVEFRTRQRGYFTQLMNVLAGAGCGCRFFGGLGACIWGLVGLGCWG